MGKVWQETCGRLFLELNPRKLVMFKTEKTAKYGLLGFMAFDCSMLPLAYMHSDYSGISFLIGFGIVLIWTYLNPWILLLEFGRSHYFDRSRMEHNYLLIAGWIIFISIAIKKVLG